MNDSFDRWASELFATGQIVQDDDQSVTWPERQRRFERYVALVEAVTGAEGIDAASALIRSLQAPEDYGAYQATWRALGRFPDSIFVGAALQELPTLISRQPQWAGDLLCGIANAQGTTHEPVLHEFRRQLAVASAATQQIILAYIHEQEHAGWLRHRVGVLST